MQMYNLPTFSLTTWISINPGYVNIKNKSLFVLPRDIVNMLSKVVHTFNANVSVCVDIPQSRIERRVIFLVAISYMFGVLL